MPNKLYKPPKDLIKEWPEVFEDLYMNTMPIFYLEALRLEFSNGSIWEIDVQEQLANITKDLVAEKILETFAEYSDEIVKVDFKIDINRLKKDIEESSKNIL